MWWLLWGFADTKSLSSTFLWAGAWSQMTSAIKAKKICAPAIPNHAPAGQNIIICCTCHMCPRVVDQATQVTTREYLSSGFPTKRVLNQSLWLNRLTRNLNFSRSKCRYDSSKKADNKVAVKTAQAGLRLYCYKSPKTGFCSRGPIAIHERLENTGNMVTQTQLLFAQSLQSICS